MLELIGFVLAGVAALLWTINSTLLRIEKLIRERAPAKTMFD